MRGNEFFEIAKHLLGNPPARWQEAAERTAASRIYYAAFIYSRDLMETWGCSFTENAVHTQVAEGLKASRELELVRIGKKISELHDERKRADYQTKAPEGFDFARLEALYEDVVRELQNRWAHLGEHARQAAMREIRARIASYQS